MGPVLNAFNRFVIPHVAFLTGYEILANLTLSAVGAVVLVVTERVKAI